MPTTARAASAAGRPVPRSVGGCNGPLTTVADDDCDGDGVGVGRPARNGVLPAGGLTNGVTGGGAAVGGGGAGRVGVGLAFADGEDFGVGVADAECVGGGVEPAGLGAACTTMLPCAVPAAPVAVTAWVPPAGPAL